MDEKRTVKDQDGKEIELKNFNLTITDADTGEVVQKWDNCKTILAVGIPFDNESKDGGILTHGAMLCQLTSLKEANAAITKMSKLKATIIVKNPLTMALDAMGYYDKIALESLEKEDGENNDGAKED